MEERYTRLYSQSGMLYQEGSPVIVTAGAVLSDSLTRSVLVQLKFKSISGKEISSLTAHILPLNANGESTGDAVEYYYNELDAHRDDSFGTKTAVVMPNGAVRSYKVRVSLVCFSDGSRWQGGEDYFSTLSSPRRLENALDDEELCHQFRISYGGDCNYLPSEEGGLWFCTCGAINRSDEAKCYRCRRVYSALKNISLPSLRSEATKRVANEKKYEEEEDVESSQKRAKMIKLFAVLIPVVVLLTVLLATLPGYYGRISDYDKALTLLESGKYDLAQEAFEKLGDYEDSRELAEKEIPYRRAVYIMNCAQNGDTDGLVMLGMKRSELGMNETVSTALYRKAAEMFTALGDYKDSAEQAAKAESSISDYYDSVLLDSYNEAAALFGENSFCRARDAFAALDNYKDSASMVKECIYKKAELLLALTDKYSMEGIYCSLSTVTGEKSVFYIPQSIYVKLGSGISSDIRDICAADGVEINYEDAPESGCLPYCDAVAALFASLGDYKDSAEKAGAAADAGDYTKPFYELIRSGKNAEALTWLNEFKGEFPDRERWTNFISIYLPFCGVWQFDNGDPTLIPVSVGMNFSCNTVTTAVFLSEDGGAQLYVYPEGNTDFPIALTPNIKEDGSITFSASPDGATVFYLAINNAGKLNYSKYNSNVKTAETQCAVYKKIG